MVRQFELVEKVKRYDPNADEDALNRAYVFAMKAHGSQTRASGDPYFSHPVDVAGILATYRLDSASIITALLHDTVEDTGATLEEIEKYFGKEVARLVDGVTKLSRIELQSDHSRQAENFRKLVLAMSEDIRVLLVKLADRLHNMRTLCHIDNADRRRKIALETLEIFAPLAERIGMDAMKTELEDLAFAEINPEARDSIQARLEYLRQQGGDVSARIITKLNETFTEAGVTAEVSGREKMPYSIWRKMQRKNVGFEQLADIMAFRVVVDTIENCYRALGVIHAAYPMIHDRFKDYISTPKPNGYRSIHTAVIGPERQRIEIQVRTRDMHAIAELGVASHWQYKHGVGLNEGRQYKWLRELLEILEHAAEPEEFLEHTKLEMFHDQVFCFTPKGDLINLPVGATPVDFAYAVHSEIGDTCVGCRINGRMMPLRSKLLNGDQVDIIISKAQTPSPTWERFAVTGKARARIRRFIRGRERDQYLELGKAIIERAFKEAESEYSTKAVKEVVKTFAVETVDDLFVKVGSGHVTGREVIEAIFPGMKPKPAQDKVVPITKARKPAARGVAGIPIKGLIPGMAVHFAGCCHPLPGDRIVGIVTTGKGVTIHTIDCDSLQAFAEAPERWLDVAWDVDGRAGGDGNHTGRIHLTCINAPGSLGNLSMVIGRNNGNISNLKITNRSQDFFDLMLDIEVRDVKHLSEIIAALRAIPVINSVDRARG
ncbi:MAG: bifunctional (p)ppGpp synthetase/guanosine-3',5'-bis(diphosphate) 3'-pyrophosphohydrolase [Rhodospirillales bacterium]|nr:bifunctional (p)ppGpp synthetase/guanosine-3',5'-bis(diphosphate) 3'-pyrophosphohydrolase [Rhodospirillales bacterium]